MRILAAALLGSVLAASSGQAVAATVIIYTNPMTLDRRTVIIDSDGPDRAFHCMLPPATSGCQQIPIRRERS